VSESDGDGDADVDAVADAEGVGAADFDGLAVGLGANNVGSAAGVARVLGWGDRERSGLPPGGWLLAAGVLDAAAVLWDWSARTPVACRPVTATSVAATAATTHSVMAVAAVAVPGLARILSQLKIPRSPLEPTAARRSTDVSASEAFETLDTERVAASSRTGSRNPAGSAGSGSSRASTSGRSDPCRRLEQTGQ